MRKQVCMTPGCKHTKILARGLCDNCYQSLSRLVQLERTTWKELEKKGLSRPARIGRPPGKAYQAALNK